MQVKSNSNDQWLEDLWDKLDRNLWLDAKEIGRNTRRWRDERDEAVAKRKLPDVLPEPTYTFTLLEIEIRRSLADWQYIRKTNDAVLAEQARTRIRRAWEALHLPLDKRQKIAVLRLWVDYQRELLFIKAVLRQLRRAADQRENISSQDRKDIASQWQVSVKDINEIWISRKTWKRLVRERLSDRYRVSLERLNRLLPIGKRTYTSRIPNRFTGTIKMKTITEPLLPDYVLKASLRKTRTD